MLIRIVDAWWQNGTGIRKYADTRLTRRMTRVHALVGGPDEFRRRLDDCVRLSGTLDLGAQTR